MSTLAVGRYTLWISAFALVFVGCSQWQATIPINTVQSASASGRTNRTKLILVGTGWKSPGLVAVDSTGNVYVADSRTEIREVLPPFTGRTHGRMRTVVTDSVWGVALDVNGNLYYSRDENPGYIEQLTPKGVKYTVTSDCGTGFFGIAVDADENVYAAGGAFLYRIAHKPGGGWKKCARFGPEFNGNGAVGIAVDLQRNIYVADSFGNEVRKFEPSGKSVIVGSRFNGPVDVAVPLGCKAACPVYVSDSSNNAVKKVSPPFDGPSHGKISKVGYGFSDPQGVAAKSSSAYVADFGNLQVKEVIP